MIEKHANSIGYVAGHWPFDPEKPTIVFIHGSGGTSVLWENQVDALKPFVNTVALDLPGHGRSSGPGMDLIEDYAIAVGDFIKAIEVPMPIPCGLSIGGAIVLQLILEYEERFKSAILVSTGARLRVSPEILDGIEKDYNAFVDSIPVFAASAKTDIKKLKPLLAASAACGPEVTYGDFKACDRFDVMKRLPDINIPALVLAAEDDRMTPPKYSDYMKEHIRNAVMVLIKDTGHLLPMERPEVFNRAVVDFLKKEVLAYPD